MRTIRPLTVTRRTAGAGAAFLLVGALAAATAAAVLTDVAVPSYAVPLLGAASGTVTLDQGVPATLVVALSTNNPQVVNVPSGVPVQPGTTRGVFVATGLGPGCATITAKLGERTRSRYVVVHPASSATTLSMAVPNQFVPLGATVSVPVRNGTGPGIGEVALTSSNPAIVTVPPSVPLVRGSGSFPLNAKGEGCATVTATLGSQVVRRTVQVIYVGG